MQTRSPIGCKARRCHYPVSSPSCPGRPVEQLAQGFELLPGAKELLVELHGRPVEARPSDAWRRRPPRAA
jgi:hypothetical protein